LYFVYKYANIIIETIPTFNLRTHAFVIVAARGNNSKQIPSAHGRNF